MYFKEYNLNTYSMFNDALNFKFKSDLNESNKLVFDFKI